MLFRVELKCSGGCVFGGNNLPQVIKQCREYAKNDWETFCVWDTTEGLDFNSAKIAEISAKFEWVHSDYRHLLLGTN